MAYYAENIVFWGEAYMPFFSQGHTVLLGWLKAFSWPMLRADALAGLTVAFVAVPQAMAYALIAGLPPQYGMYAAIVPVVVTALLGSSRYTVAGPTNAIAMILYTTLGQLVVGGVLLSGLPQEQQLPYVFGLALLTGLIQVGMGLARLGDLVNYISFAVLVGFMSGAAVLIAAGQLNNALGLHVPAAVGFFPQLRATVGHLPATHIASLGITVATVLCSWLLHRLVPRWPHALLTLVIISGLCALLGAEAWGVRFAAAMPQGLPPFSLPPDFDFGVINELFAPALAIALMGAVESLSTGKNLATVHDDRFDGNRQLVAQGLGNMGAAFSSAMPGGGSLTRSALNMSAGARTRLAAVFSGLFVLLLLLAFAPLTAYIPMPALAGILLQLSWSMVHVRDIHFCFVTTRVDRMVLLLTFVSTLLLSLQQAVLLGVMLSLALFIYRVAHPHVQCLAPEHELLRPYPWVARHPELAVYLVEGVLFFGAIQELEARLRKAELRKTQVAVLSLSRVFWLDASGVHALEHFIERSLARDISVVLVVGNEQVMAILQRSGLLDMLHGGFVAHTLAEGLELSLAVLRSRSRVQPQPAVPPVSK